MMAASPYPFTWRQKEGQVYLFAAVAILAATALRFLAQPVFANSAPYIVYILPIMAAAAYGGFSPGLFTTVLSTAVIVSVFLRGRVLAFPDAPYLFLFLLDGLYISWLGEQMRIAMRDALSAHSEAEAARVRERTILNSVSDGVGSLDEHWQFVHANEQLARLTLLPATELLGKRLWDAWPELAERRARQELKRAFDEHVPVRFEVCIPRLDCWYETCAYPQKLGLSLFSHDITDRKRAERLLRESEERLRLAPEAARIGTWTFSLQTQKITWSLELEQIFGLAPGSFAGTEEAFFSLVHPDDRQHVRDTLGRATEQVSRCEAEFRYQNAGGEIRWMLCRGSVYSDPTGKPTRLVGIAMDITDQKRNEEQLRHTQRLESLGILAGGIAHDFNNLLVGILGNASLASDSLPAGHPAKAQLQEVFLAGEKAAHLTRQMLAYAGKGHFVIERLELSTLVREAERLVRSSIVKNVDLRLDLKPGLPRIEADAGQMQQLIMNLVINAAEAIPPDRPGTVLVRTSLQRLNQSPAGITSGQDLAAGDYVVLEVHDTGVGMDEATRAKIFEPFFTTKFVGRGLGLSAALGIVRSHKGALQVTSTPGMGATFQVFLPTAQPARTEDPRAGVEVNLQGEGSILVVDDESAVRVLAQAVLRKYGYTVLLAHDALGAIQALRRTASPVALILMDLSMPGMNTRDAIEEIQRCWPATRVVLSSGYGENEALDRFRGMQLAGFIQKPYTPAQLAERIKAAINNGHSGEGCLATAPGASAVVLQ
ncbi:MAG TPA: PAS domain S-box protein [Bryobacteraceae bacterium]|nr:PAS domain S-box protein [Bryobacteraceae bacterium]